MRKSCIKFWHSVLKLEKRGEAWLHLSHLRAGWLRENVEAGKERKATSYFRRGESKAWCHTGCHSPRLACWQSLKDAAGSLPYCTDLWRGSACFISFSFLSPLPRQPISDLTTGAISPDRGISLMQFWQNSSVQLSSILLLKPQEAHTLLIDSMQLERHSGTFKTSSFKTFSFCLCLLEFSLWEKPVAT